MNETVESGASDAVETNVELPAETVVSESTTHPQGSEEATTEPSEVEQTDKEPDGSEEKAKKPGGWKRKLDRQAAYIQELEARVNAQTKPAEQAVAGTDEPKEADYDNVLDWVKAQAKWEAKQELGAFQTAQEQKAQEQNLQKAIDAHVAREEVFAETVPDYEEKVTAVMQSGLVNTDIQKAVLQSDMSEKIAYHLSEFPSDLLIMQNLKGQALKNAIATIEDFIESNPKAAVKQTKATAPITPVSSKAGVSSKNPADMDQADYERWRGLR